MYFILWDGGSTNYHMQDEFVPIVNVKQCYKLSFKHEAVRHNQLKGRYSTEVHYTTCRACMSSKSTGAPKSLSHLGSH